MAKKLENLYFIEVTDTFGGDANYSWVTRHVIRANTLRGAVNRFSKLSGMEWHCTDSSWGDMESRYDSKSGATCYFIGEYEPERHAELRLETDERN